LIVAISALNSITASLLATVVATDVNAQIAPHRSLLFTVMLNWVIRKIPTVATVTMLHVSAIYMKSVKL
jgi:hypothetical protein